MTRRKNNTDIVVVAQMEKTITDLLKQRQLSGKWSRLKAGPLKWDIERDAVIQQLSKSDYTARIAHENPMSVFNAMLEAASLGLSLQKSLSHAYLTPETVNERPQIVCTVSYRGLEWLAMSSGSVKHVQTELVYSNDVCRRGMDREGRNYVEFEMARGERGDLEGGFCRLRLPNNELHLEWMSLEELLACEKAAEIKNKGASFSPWKGPFKNEMYKKCIVRRAAKHVVLSPTLVSAFERLDRMEPMDFTKVSSPATDTQVEAITDDHMLAIRKILQDKGMELEHIDHWMERQVEAWGHGSLDNFPDSEWERLRDALVDRYEKVLKVREKKQDGKDTTSEEDVPRETEQ